MDSVSSSEQGRRLQANAQPVVAGVLAIAAIALLWYLFDVLLLIFAATLLAVLIRVPTASLAQRAGIAQGWALAIVLLVAALLFSLASWLLGAAIAQQAQALYEQLPQLAEQASSYLQQYSWWPSSLSPRAVLQGDGSTFLGRGLQIVTGTFGAIANVLLVVFMAVLLAAQPELYIRGSLRLIPLSKRARAHEIVLRLGETMRHWLLGQLLLMIFVAVCSTVGLWLLDVPYALTVGLLAGLLTFIPFVGPLIAAAIAVLVSFTVSLTTALWTALLYVAIQTVEGVLEPLVQQRTVYLPPVLLLIGQVTLGVLVGMLGIIVAAPLTAVLMIAVQMAYVEDILGDRQADAPA